MTVTSAPPAADLLPSPDLLSPVARAQPVDRLHSPGTTVTLLSQRGGRPYTATVQSFRQCPADHAVTTQVSVGEGAARRLANNEVWVSVPTPGAGFAVWAGTATMLDGAALDITGLTPVFHEDRRREAPRVTAEAEVTVISGSRATRRVLALDLSRGGVRVAVHFPDELLLGEFVIVDVHLAGGPKVLLRGEVIRVDRATREAVVRFDRPGPEETTQLDRYVLARLGQLDSAGA